MIKFKIKQKNNLSPLFLSQKVKKSIDGILTIKNKSNLCYNQNLNSFFWSVWLLNKSRKAPHGQKNRHQGRGINRAKNSDAMKMTMALTGAYSGLNALNGSRLAILPQLPAKNNPAHIIKTARRKYSSPASTFLNLNFCRQHFPAASCKAPNGQR